MKEGGTRRLKYDGMRPYMIRKQEWRGGEMVGREVEGRGISWACLSRKSLVRADLKEWSEGQGRGLWRQLRGQ
jgi:hypothetical protein